MSDIFCFRKGWRKTTDSGFPNLDFVNKFEEIPTDTSKGDKVSFSDDQRQVNDFDFAAGKKIGYSEKMCKLFRKTTIKGLTKLIEKMSFTT